MMKLGNCLASATPIIGSAFLGISMMVCGTTRPAYADGGGCSSYSSVPISGVPAGAICISVKGKGTNIDSMKGYWLAPSLSNWRIDWVIYDRGKTYWRDNGPTHASTNYGSGERTRGKGSAPAGSELCAELYNTSRNTKIDAACVSITN